MVKVLGFFFLASMLMLQGFIAGALWDPEQTASDFLKQVKSQAQPVEYLTFGPAILMVLVLKLLQVSFK